MQEGKAYIETSLVYTDSNNNLQSVRTCERSDSAEPIPMSQVTDGCTIRHDFGNNVSEEMAMWTYERDGQYFQASPCSTTGQTYPHEKVFKKNGVNICQSMVDLEGRRVIPQYRTQITVNGVSQYIDQCTPESSAALEINSTTDGCMNAAEFNHDITAGVSYGLERFYYEDPNRVYVSSCQQSDSTYVHDVAVTSWKYNDEKKTAQPLSTVTINVAGQTYPIATHTLLPGAPEVAYASLGIESVQDLAGRYYEGCNTFIPTKRSEVYERPDGTKLYVAISNGTPIDEGDKCTREEEKEPIMGRKKISIGYATVQKYRHDPDHSRSIGRCGKWSGNVDIYHWWKKRTKITYPDGEVTYTDWKNVEEFTGSKYMKLTGRDYGDASCR